MISITLAGDVVCVIILKHMHKVLECVCVCVCEGLYSWVGGTEV